MSNTLLVSNLHPSINSSALEDMFTLVGNVRKARVEQDPDSGANLGRGSVEMATREEAENCVHHFHQQAVNGQKLVVWLRGLNTFKRPVQKRKHA